MKRSAFRITPQGWVLVVATVLVIPLAVITNATALYGVAIALVLLWALIAIRSTSPLYRQYVEGERLADEAEERWRMD